MSSNFTSLRSSRTSLLSQLAAAVKQETAKGGGADERFWKLSVDQKTKNGYARIRFLPAPKGEEIPWVRVFSHAFQGPGGSWFIENCPTTLGRTCPICQENSKFWNTGIDADKEVARKRKRKLQFISNILVIEDPAHPENNGKTFLYKYGAKIQGKITELLEPEFPDQKPANPFDLWEGCDFKLKSAHVAGYQNYDKSSFDDPKELFPGDDAKKEKLWEAEYPLAEFVDEKQFKTFEELAERLNKALTGSATGPKTVEEAVKQAAPTLQDAKDLSGAATATKLSKKTAAPKIVAPEVAPDDEDDIKAFFSGLDDSD